MSTTPESITGAAEQEEVAPVYTDMFGENSPPAPFKTYRSGRLSLQQINNMMADAYAHKLEAGDSLIPDFGGARERFAAKHEIVNGLWVAKATPVSTSTSTSQE